MDADWKFTKRLGILLNWNGRIKKNLITEFKIRIFFSGVISLGDHIVQLCKQTRKSRTMKNTEEFNTRKRKGLYDGLQCADRG